MLTGLNEHTANQLSRLVISQGAADGLLTMEASFSQNWTRSIKINRTDISTISTDWPTISLVPI